MSHLGYPQQTAVPAPKVLSKFAGILSEISTGDCSFFYLADKKGLDEVSCICLVLKLLLLVGLPSAVSNEVLAEAESVLWTFHCFDWSHAESYRQGCLHSASHLSLCLNLRPYMLHSVQELENPQVPSPCFLCRNACLWLSSWQGCPASESCYS